MTRLTRHVFAVLLVIVAVVVAWWWAASLLAPLIPGLAAVARLVALVPLWRDEAELEREK